MSSLSLTKNFRSASSLLLAGLLAGAAPPLPASAPKALDPEIAKAMDRVFPALVRITIVEGDSSEGSLEKHTGAGSGAIINKKGYVVTNHHVAGKASHLLVRLADGEEIEAQLIGTDPLADIAIIKLDLSQRKSKTPLPVASFGNSDRVRVGDTVFAMGSPMAVSQSVTKGIVSNTQLMMPSLFWFAQFKLDGENVGSLVRWIGHDAVIFGGNSGGPLVNVDGEIIGINEIGLGSLGGAIPANLVRQVAEQLINHGRVDRSWTGLEPQPYLRGADIARGVFVAGVIPGSPAAVAGLRAGDVVTQFDGVAVNGRLEEDLPSFNALVMGTPIGKTVSVKALRDGRESTYTLTTQARGKAIDDDQEFKDWGFTARNFTRLSAIERKRHDTNGVHVTTVNPSGPAGSAKPAIQADDCLVSIASQPVRCLADLHRITAEVTRDTNHTGLVVVEFERGVSRMITAVRPKPEEHPPEENAAKPGLAMLLQPIGPELSEAMNLKQNGARISFVFPGHAADKAGFRAGDILTQFDGDNIRCREESELKHFMAVVRRHQPGDVAPCKVVRDGKPVSLTLTLEAEDVDEENLKSYKDKDLEFTLRDMTENECILQQIPAEVRGPRIAEVKSSGWASLAHIAVNDIVLSIDGKPVPDTATAEAILQADVGKKSRHIVLHLRRGVHTLFAEMEPVWDVPSK
jgi:serine protease Do